MFHRTFLRSIIVLASIGFYGSFAVSHAQDDDSHRGRKYKSPPPSARIEITVVRDLNAKPIVDAHVIFHPLAGDKDNGYLELKTNEDGKVVIDVLPIGDTVRMQVIAHGYQTYGQDYKVDKAEMSMEVRMKRPGAQYSIYKNSTASPGDTPAPDKSDNAPQKSAPPDSGTKPDAPPSANQTQPK